MLLLTVGLILALLPGSVVSQPSSTAPLPNPTRVPCPSNVTLVRSAGPAANQTLSSGERSYVSSRTTDVLPAAWQAYLKNVNASTSSPLPSYVSNLLTNSSNGTFPKLGIAVSGGSYRAALFGAAVLSSLDGRNTTAVGKGTGGLLQAATYLSGLSGGSWLVISLSQANFPTIPDLVFPSAASPPSDPNAVFGGFQAQVDLISPGPSPQDTLTYLETLLAEAKAKKQASGLPITITDPWSMALARHFINGTTAQNILGSGTHGAGILLSGIPNLPSFRSHAQPFPIVIVNAIPPNPNVSDIVSGDSVPLTNEIWEFNVFESGSWDPSLASFIPTSLLGSTNSSNCMAGLDQASFIAGMSSNLFNEFNVSANAITASPIGPLIALVQNQFPSEGVRLDSAAVPNPFKGVNPSSYTSSNQDFLALVDGGSNGEVVPLQPLLVRARGIDTIIAVDAAADTVDNFSNGTDLINTAKRAALYGSQYPFPSVPSTPDSFVQLGLNRRPTFFGCNDSTETPMVIYIANGGPPLDGAAPVTNRSTAQTTYSPQEVQSFLDQAFLISSQGINGSDPQWGACLACAVVDRARARIGVQRVGVCASCMERYCWNGQGGNTSGGGSGSTGKNGAKGVSESVLTAAIGLGFATAWLGAAYIA